ncbi:MAG TPA: molecular chaperone HtpG [Muribaculum sp.]|jgi:molecular chaperone HtpG|uniref:Molecular chaperone HtpG n=1 Tax=Heminiphilus faecis TaxID=2601703 RepID=A0ABV4CV56_9BACT|nr:molecular chaperone HtpG [Heminiphilus faecis]RLT77628.1 molecular chaperone HtpG [bacterium J10(2018)]HRF67949.1 molecular chaperone HtpG [Muribaculum sp.]
MSTQKGTIGVTTENIFPVIKKFLYSDHEIFLRELVSNAIDATNKLKTLSSFGEYKGDLGEMNVKVSVDKEAGTLTVSDHGIGMTADDIEKYINQIAFSGAEEFLAKYKDKADNIIGHFGLGFYSAFMVAKKVEIRTLSYKDGAQAVNWICDGSPEYEMQPIEKTERGTDIILYIDDDNKEFLEQARIDTLLKKYCRFLPVPVLSGKEQEWKDGKYVDTDKDKVINNTEPAWTKKPSELTDDDYLAFYRELYPGQDDPLFWIHLNVDYPFTLTGILYFPKIKNNIDVTRNRIQLYCNQVFVTDSVEGVVPEFMMLMQGVIDSPDIPLNVSRSYLQSDTAVKKISTYITRKVADRLEEIFKNNRTEYEQKWDDIKLFIEYGMLTDEKFCERAMKFVLVKDTEGKYYTLDEYKTLIEAEQTDKDSNIVYLYSTDTVAQYNYINAATDKGYSVLVMDGQFDSHFIGLLEQKLEKSHFVRVDSDVIDNLIRKEDRKAADLTPEQRNILTTVFKSQVPKVEKAEFLVTFEALAADAAPLVITQNEYMRRMKDMAAMQPGMSFYGELPDSYNLIVNTEHTLIKEIRDDADKTIGDKVKPISTEIEKKNAEITTLRDSAKDGKMSEEDNGKVSELEKEVSTLRDEETKLISDYAAEQSKVKQLLDLALLGNGLLKGQDLSNFIKRSISML